jgi:hypothetical protein
MKTLGTTVWTRFSPKSNEDTTGCRNYKILEEIRRDGMGSAG